VHHQVEDRVRQDVGQEITHDTVEGTGPPDDGSWRRQAADAVDLTDTEMDALLLYFAEFLTVPPRAYPAMPKGDTVKRLAKTDRHYQKGFVLRKAQKAGFPGGKADEGMLAWLIDVGVLRPETVVPDLRRRGLPS
jgi:hypothetical protein